MEAIEDINGKDLLMWEALVMEVLEDIVAATWWTVWHMAQNLCQRIEWWIGMPMIRDSINKYD